MRVAHNASPSGRTTLMALIGLLLIVSAVLVWGGNVVVAATPTAQPALAGIEKRAIVRGGGADLREQPGGPVIQKLSLGTAVMAVARTPDDQWIKINVDEDTAGWVRRDEIVLFGMSQLPVLDVEIGDMAAAPETTSEAATSPTESTETTESVATTESEATATVTARRLNVRRGPGTNFGVIDSLASGTEAAVLARTENTTWIQIRLPETNKKGWVSASYVDLSIDPAELPISEEKSAAPVLQPRANASGGANAGLKGKLVFQEKSGGPIDIYNLATGSVRRLTTGLDPAISPDGRTVAFIRDNGEDAGLYLINVNGGNERRIFEKNGLRSPSWSPDGDRIVFSRVTGFTTCRDVGFGFCLPDNPYLQKYPLKKRSKRGLSVIDTNGGNFSDVSALDSAIAPDWDEGGIVYSSGGGIQITGTNFDTFAVVKEPRYQDPSWQPGKGPIVFHSLEKDHREIFVVNPDGNGLTALTRPPSALIEKPVQNVAPVWSPDGKHILFLSDRNGEWAFYVMDADGGNLRQLRLNAPIEYNFQSEQVASWGP